VAQELSSASAPLDRHAGYKGGALLMGLMGTAGTLSIYFVLPLMGKIYRSLQD